MGDLLWGNPDWDPCTPINPHLTLTLWSEEPTHTDTNNNVEPSVEVSVEQYHEPLHIEHVERETTEEHSDIPPFPSGVLPCTPPAQTGPAPHCACLTSPLGKDGSYSITLSSRRNSCRRDHCIRTRKRTAQYCICPWNREGTAQQELHFDMGGWGKTKPTFGHLRVCPVYRVHSSQRVLLDRFRRRRRN